MVKYKFTLIELMFVVTILVILISIGFVAGTKTLRKQAYMKTKAEIKMIESACRQYKDRYGNFPDITGSEVEVDFLNHLAKIPDIASFTGDRKMFIDCKKHAINTEGNKILDPYEQVYMYQYAKNKILIWSVGLDGIKSKDDVTN